MITQFPKFKKLNLEHKASIEKYVSQYPPYSDYNFTSLYTYNTQESIEISLLYDNLVVKFDDYLTQKPFYSFLGHRKINPTINVLLNFADKKGVEKELKLIPEIIINSQEIDKNTFIEEDVDNHDYILSTHRVSLLRGNKYHDKRNLVNQFKRKYPRYKLVSLDMKNKKTKNEMLELFEIWEKKLGKNRQETNNELTAIKRLFKSIGSLRVYALGIYLDQKIIGFSIYETAHDHYGMISFQKADRSYSGIYESLNMNTAKHLLQLGCRYINYEQDLGIAGLKRAKSLWRPVHYLKKYIISPKK